MFNDDIKLTQGLVETTYAERPEETEKDYVTTDKNENKLNNAIISLDKANSQIVLNTNAISKNTNDINEANASIELNSKAINTANSQIILKANAQGKIVQVKLESDASAGSTFTIDADQIDLNATDILNLLSGNTINLTSKNITISSTNFKVDKNGNIKASNAELSGKITSNSGEIGGFTLGSTQFKSSLSMNHTYTSSDLNKVSMAINGTYTPTDEEMEYLDVDGNGTLTVLDLAIINNLISDNTYLNGTYELNTNKSNKALRVYDKNGNVGASISVKGGYFKSLGSDDGRFQSLRVVDGNDPTLYNKVVVHDGNINKLSYQPSYMVVNTSFGDKGITWWDSDKKLKNNIKNSEVKALDVISKIKHREYDRNDREEHSYNGYIAQELQEINNQFVFEVKQQDGTEILNINQPALIPYITKAIQEQQSQIEKLKEEIEKLKEMIKNG